MVSPMTGDSIRISSHLWPSIEHKQMIIKPADCSLFERSGARFE
jgi:hypothetical protein